MSKLINTDCLSCNCPTNQKVLFCKSRIESSDIADSEEILLTTKTEYAYMVIQCAGCNTISFLERMTFLEPRDPDEPPTVVDMNYPEETYQGFNFLSEDDLDSLPKTLRVLYFEVMAAFRNESELLSGVGLRMLVEALCMEQKVEGSNLQKKVVGLKDQGLISANELPILDKLRLIGNIAAHNIKRLPLYQLSYALEIVNHVLISIYILPKISKQIKIK